MTATINGITVTGTPDEIYELIKKQGASVPKIEPYNPETTTPINPYYPGNAWWGIYPPYNPCNPHDVYGNPVPYCSAKDSVESTNSAILNTTGEVK